MGRPQAPGNRSEKYEDNKGRIVTPCTARGNLLQLPVGDFVWRAKIALFELLPGEIEAGSHVPRKAHL